jgi:hypothetical protein
MMKSRQHAGIIVFLGAHRNQLQGEEEQYKPQYIAVPHHIEAGRFAGVNSGRSVDAQFFDPEAEGARVKSQDRGGTRRPLYSPVGLTENSQDMVAFRGRQILQRFVF